MTDNGYIPIGVDVDEQSFADLNRSVDTADSQLGQLVDTNAAIAQSADEAGSRLQNAFAKMKSSIDDNISSIQSLRQEVQGLGADTETVSQSSGGGDGGDGGGGGAGGNISGLRRSGAILNRAGLGAVGQPLQIAGEAEQLSRTFGDIGDSLKNVVDAGGPATDVIKGIGGDLGVLATAGGLAAVALGAIVAVGAAFKSEIDNDSKGLSDAITQVDDYYKAIEKGTTDSIQLQLQAAQIQKANDDAKEAQLQKDYDVAHPAGKVTDNETADVGAAATNIVSFFSGSVRQLNTDLEASKKSVSDDSNQIIALTQALGSNAVAANDAAEAQNNYVKSLEANKVHAQQLADFEATATSKQIQDKVDANKNQITADSDLYASLSTITNPTKETTAEINRLHGEIDQLTNDDKQLSGAVLEAAKAHEAETAAIENASKAVTDHSDAVQKQEQSEVDAVNKYNSAVQSAEDTAAQARITANNKLQDALVAATQKAADAAQQALDQLQQKQADNLQSYNQDVSKETRDANDKLLDDQVKAQRQEASDLQTHLDNLKQIRDADQARQQDDLLNRNFRDLFALSEQKTQDTNKENDRYAQQQQQRQQALTQTEQDQARAEDIQRRERLIAYQIAQDDAQKQYQRALEQADAAHTKAIQAAENSYQKELTALNQSLTAKEALLKQDAINQLKVLQQTEDEKLQIFNNTLDQVNQLLSSAGGSSVSSPSAHAGQSVFTPYAAGGPIIAGQSALVNDGSNRESFNNSLFPAGLGIFIPAQSGSINPNGGGSSKSVANSNTFYITSNDPAGVRREVLNVMKEITK